MVMNGPLSTEKSAQIFSFSVMKLSECEIPKQLKVRKSEIHNKIRR